ncbi:MAG: dihydroxyacetone kinase subunit L [Anaerolineales bacterium]|nr:dihydroxyacetone kinase subunit L [Anaerolineales bacterium]MCB9126564.1 dihydroxyacetone kinase subunit L [Ardenticatenales bacterium]MCB9172510.1 dihydroxyacetone kinase subunit L [Ardenticatenales bacterium]
MVTQSQVLAWLDRYADLIAEQREYLTELDAAIGDADHGINMNRGFQKVKSQLPTMADKDIGSILKNTGMALLSSVGGASGPLYGTLFMRAGMKVDKKQALTADDLLALLQGGLEGVIQRGKSQVGDKTMIDAFQPAVEGYEAATHAGKSVVEALTEAADAAEAGRDATLPLIARKGRASYLGERSKDHLDPGATSLAMLIRTLAESAAEG